MSESEVVATNLKTKGDKARAVARVGQEMLSKGFTRTQASGIAEHEIKHALADTGEGEFSLKRSGELTVPTYSSLGDRTDQEKIKIALAPKDPSPTDIKIATEAQTSLKKRKKIFGLF
jgi:hypothetical protein